MGENYQHLTWRERLIIETRLKDGWSKQRIADELGRHVSTIYREIKRGEVPELNARCRPAYRAEVAEKRVTEAYRKRGRRKATE